ncbi:LOW QUALITY PROTEIN: Hypothetical protein PHPALM_16789 [Phytophthora palmivora]|uniref:Uncharacterized protein n=1 Tax=Phytophthora palmivora TaxID=4796 RepID=A0A2P4XNW5_9STRA|nr:LOW QUALITY PROTEIN: Hypothetical protein PHPALM_16789 [Phytophthora palmivora]
MCSPTATPASAPAPASASVPTSTPVLTPVSTLPSEAAESKLSVNDYLAQQQQKRAERAKTVTPTTVLGDSAVLASNGSVPVDYESDSEEGANVEDEVPSSSDKKDSQPSAGHAVHDDPDASSPKLPRSDIDAASPKSEAPAVPRTEPPVRDTWMPSARVIADRVGNLLPPHPKPLYVCHNIVDVASAIAMKFEPLSTQRRDYYIALFHELRHWNSKKTSRNSKVPEWQALCQSWNAFVENFNKDPQGYRDRLAAARERFGKFSKRVKIERLHNEAVEAGIPCAVPIGINCSHCPIGAVRLGDAEINGYTSVRVPEQVKDLRASYEGAPESSSAANNRNTSRGITHRVHGGLPGERIVSSEFENEPDLGSSSDSYDPLSDPHSGGSSFAECAAGKQPPYAQPRAEHSASSLHVRVKALEDLQSAEFAALKQGLSVVKAQVAQTSIPLRTFVLYWKQSFASFAIALLRSNESEASRHRRVTRARNCYRILDKTNYGLSFLDKVHYSRTEIAIQFGVF